MSSIGLSASHVCKRFRRGERHDSLRDLLPDLVRRTIKKGLRQQELRENDFWALRDISFEIPRGQAVGFIGHNGAGKSTLLKLLSGIMRPTLGTLQVNGRLSALIEVGAGFHQDLTGRENVFLNGVILGMQRAEIRRKFDDIVEFAGLEEFIDTPVKRYSSGMYARLGFSVAAHMEPDILVVDEVLSVGDQVFQQRSLEKMRSVLGSGATVIFVSHNLRAITELCSRAILLRKGEVVEDGPSSQVVHTYLEKIRQAQSESLDKDVIIESAVVSGEEGVRSDFDSGERAGIEVIFRARRAVKKLVCVIYVLDSQQNLVFMVSSEALGTPVYTMEPGELRRFSCHLSLHLPSGTFSLNAMLCEPTEMKALEWVQPVATLLMRSPVAMKGVANLYPQLVTDASSNDVDALTVRQLNKATGA